MFNGLLNFEFNQQLLKSHFPAIFNHFVNIHKGIQSVSRCNCFDLNGASSCFGVVNISFSRQVLNHRFGFSIDA